jgi:hypothetical protein
MDTSALKEKKIANTNALNNFTGTVGYIPQTHCLIGVIGDHALQDRNRTKCVCINTNVLNDIEVVGKYEALYQAL